jgi:DNA mismatch endonuclease (patch repair protein)
MADVFSIDKRSEVMAAIRSSGNLDTELKLAALFKTHGITGWRRNQALLGKPDFVFRKQRVVVFVDGCFWHGCQKHGRKPGTNRAYWLPKLRRSKEHDEAARSALSKASSAS